MIGLGKGVVLKHSSSKYPDQLMKLDCSRAKVFAYLLAPELDQRSHEGTMRHLR
jgi:hypothetical protein